MRVKARQDVTKTRRHRGKRRATIVEDIHPPSFSLQQACHADNHCRYFNENSGKERQQWEGSGLRSNDEIDVYE